MRADNRHLAILYFTRTDFQMLSLLHNGLAYQPAIRMPSFKFNLNANV